MLPLPPPKQRLGERRGRFEADQMACLGNSHDLSVRDLLAEDVGVGRRHEAILFAQTISVGASIRHSLRSNPFSGTGKRNFATVRKPRDIVSSISTCSWVRSSLSLKSMVSIIIRCAAKHDWSG